MAKSVKLTTEHSYWTCPGCDKPHLALTVADKVRCTRCGKEFKTTQGNLRQELKLTQERLQMVEYTLGQYKKILKGGMSELIDPIKVIVHYRCCECKVTINVPLEDIRHVSICDECDYMENYMEMVAVAIKAE